MTVGSLFAGIGGFDLGLERAGMTVKWQIEIDPFCRAVLAKHWPDVPRFEDVRTVGAELDRVDVLCGGFPCQDISVAGRGDGIDGARSGLWREFDRLIGELRPRYVIVENVSALLTRGMGRVLGDLAACGYDAEWDCLPASAFGAPHQRDRVWIVAYTSVGEKQLLSTLADATSGIRQRETSRQTGHSAFSDEDVADTNSRDEYRRGSFMQVGRGAIAREAANNGHGKGTQWGVEPDVGRVAHGIPARVDRLRGLGNAIVPQIAEWIGRQIMSREG